MHDILLKAQGLSGLERYCWCIMPSHVQIIFRAKKNNSGILLGRFKEHTSKQIANALENNTQESRKDCLPGR